MDASLRLLPWLLLWLSPCPCPWPWPWWWWLRSRLAAAAAAAREEVLEEDSLASEDDAGTDSRLSTSTASASPSVACRGTNELVVTCTGMKAGREGKGVVPPRCCWTSSPRMPSPGLPPPLASGRCHGRLPCRRRKGRPLRPPREWCRISCAGGRSCCAC